MIIVIETPSWTCILYSQGDIAATTPVAEDSMLAFRPPRLKLILATFAWCLFAVLAGTLPVAAQSCTADVQCQDGGRSRVECFGNTLVVRRSICAGSCRDIEEMRQNCSGRCNVVTASCDAESSTGQPPLGGSGGSCAISCTCRRNVLVFYRPLPDIACARHVLRCERGCSCRPEPHCN
jgi:hypothetical protein